MFSRASEREDVRDSSGKVSQEAHSATAITEVFLSLLARQVEMLKAWEQHRLPKARMKRGGSPCCCLPVKVEVGGKMKGSSFAYFPFQVDPFYASIILFLGRAWDAFTDPLVGFCISKSSWTRLGRLMPW